MGVAGFVATLESRKLVVVALACCFLPLVAQASSPNCSISVAPTSGNAPLTVSATGTCTDQDGDLTSLRLTWGDGSPPETTTQGTISSSHTYNNAGEFTVSVTGFDATGGESEDHEDVTVNSPPPPNRAPTCSLDVNPNSGQAPLDVFANANCQDPDNNIASVQITWGDGTSTPGNSPNLAAPHTYPQPGTFTVTATATDAGGLNGSDSETVTVTAAPPSNQPPSCTLSVAPTSGQVPLTVAAAGSCTDPENRLSSTTITWGDGSGPTQGASGTHTYSSAGNFQVVLTGRDAEGNSGTASRQVSVSGPPPPPADHAPSCTLNVSPGGGEAPVTVTATANCTDPENDVAQIILSFGDGFYQSGPTASHIFPHGGTFTVSATASDRAGNVSKAATQRVNISETLKLFVGVSNGQVKEFTRGGSFLRTLNTNLGGSITGMAVDSVGSLYVTNFTANTVSKFNGNSGAPARFGGGYNCKPESIVFDRSGDAFVGQSDCSKALLKLDAYGNLFGGFTAQTEATGTDWIDLASDRCTIFYTSEGASVLRFNSCSNQQLSPFATGLERALAIRLLNNGGAVVANHENIVRFDSSGRRIQSYDASGQNCWDALTIDRNGSSFWAADFCTSEIFRFDIDSGNQLAKFSSDTPANTVFGLAMKSAPRETSAAGPLIATPNAASISAGQSATFALAFDANNAARNKQFSFSCSNLPVGASCNFSPATVSVPGGGGDDDDRTAATRVNASLTINTALQTASLVKPPTSQLGLLYACLMPLVGLACFGVSPKRKKRRLAVLAVLALGLLAGAVAGCGGGADDAAAFLPPGSVGTTPPGTYNVIVTTSSGSLSSSTWVTVTVR